MDVPLSNFDLWDWCEYLKIPLKGIFARNEKMGKNHSPCIINLDSIEGFGTHWVCCWFSEKHFEYFDSFGLPPPLEWEENVKKWFPKMKTFLRNNFQIQDFPSLKCGCYCLCFLNEKKQGYQVRRRSKNVFFLQTKGKREIHCEIY